MTERAKGLADLGSRYATADGTMWPTVFALTAMDPANEKRIAALVTKAVG